jgi:hypothetical protein
MILRRGRKPGLRNDEDYRAYRLLHDILWDKCWTNLHYQSPEGIATIIIRELKDNGYSIMKKEHQ